MPPKSNKNSLSDEQLDIIKKEISNGIKEFKESQPEPQNNNIEYRLDQLSAKVDTIDDKVNKKIEQIDVAIRGNGRMGLREQVNANNRAVKIIIAMLILVGGGRFMGVSLESIFDSFKNKKKETIVETSPTRNDQNTNTQPITEVKSDGS